MQAQLRLLHTWDQQLRALLPSVRVTRVAVLAAFSLGILWAGSVTLSKVAGSLPLAASDPSRERRLRRWLANPQVTVTTLWFPLLRVLLAARAGQELLLVLDPTSLGPTRTVVLFGLVVHKRFCPSSGTRCPARAIGRSANGPCCVASAASWLASCRPTVPSPSWPTAA